MQGSAYEPRPWRRRERVFTERKVSGEEPSWEEVEEYVDEAILGLPEKIRAAIVSHFLEEESQQVTAERLGISHQTVSHRIARGIELIRRALARRGVKVRSSLLLAMLSSELAAGVPASLKAALGKLCLAGTAGSVEGELFYTGRLGSVDANGMLYLLG